MSASFYLWTHLAFEYQEGSILCCTQIQIWDDYAVDVPLEDIKKWPVMLATRSDGKYMSIENSGPTKIVFPYHAYPEIDEDIYKVLTIWNLRDVEVQ